MFDYLDIPRGSVTLVPLSLSSLCLPQEDNLESECDGKIRRQEDMVESSEELQVLVKWMQILKVMCPNFGR